MRINIYAQEITSRVELIEITAANTGSHFRGIRFYLESPDVLKPPTHPDDDESAVTFWIHSTRGGWKEKDNAPLIAVLEKALALLK
mgnify:CR=1 FL=1